MGLLGGCSSLPFADASRSSRTAAPVIPTPVPVTVLSLSEEELIEALQPDEGLWLTEVPEVTRDLFDRIRSGLAIPEVRHARIDSEAQRFANDPAFIERTFSRAAPYLGYIVEQVEARGMPMEIALLPVIESAFEPYAYSRARAVGLWQFMPATGSRFELKQDWWYDGRRDVVAATRAALDYLQYLHNMFGDWLLAVAAYNSGEGNVSRAIKRERAAGRKVNFFNLRLPAETRSYVPRLLAMARVVAGPERYGLVIEGIPDAPYFQEVETGGQINMAVAAELAGITTEEMYALNPAHHRWATDPTGPHRLLVPTGSVKAFEEGLLLLTPDQRMRVERYQVREGDTVAAIARQFGTTAQHLRELNQLGNADAVKAGSEIRVPSSVNQLPEKVLQAAARADRRPAPPGVRAVHVVRSGESLWSISRQHGVTVAQLARLNGLNQNAPLRPGQRLRLSAGSASTATLAAATAGTGQQVTYVVRSGDTLSAIARNLRVTVASLRSWNGLTNDALRPGQRLVAYVSPRS